MPPGFAAFLLVVVVTVGILAVLLRRGGGPDPRRGPWMRFAQRHGLEFRGPAARKLVMTPMHVSGEVRGVVVRLLSFNRDTESPDGRARSRTCTALTAIAPRPRPVEVTITPRHGLSGAARLLGSGDIDLGDAAFDGALVVRSSDEEAARHLLDAPLRAALLAAPRPLSFCYDAGAVRMEWLGAEVDEAALDAALAAVLAAAEAGAAEPGAAASGTRDAVTHR